MSRINELIVELCPNGVEFKSLREICYNITTGRLNANAMVKDGQYPFFTCDEKQFKIDKYAFDTEAVLVSGNGSQVGHINYYKGRFNAYQRTYVLSDFSDRVAIRFFFYYAKAYLRAYIFKHSKKGSVPYITLPMLQTFQIPVPPLKIQNEIVKVLDLFTELEAELEDELEVRKTQYTYYRDSLLRFEGKDVEWKTLGEIAKCYAGATPKTGVSEYWENGTIPWMSSGEINKGKIYNTEVKISQRGYDNCSTKIVPSNSVVIALAGQGKTRGTVAITKMSLCTNQSLCAVVVEDKNVNSDYLFYYLKTQYQELRSISSGDGNRGGLNLQMIKSYHVPIPSSLEQKRIVFILDKFDALVNDISIGLPAEIEARRKQYEYYRNRLLTFKELSNG